MPLLNKGDINTTGDGGTIATGNARVVNSRTNAAQLERERQAALTQQLTRLVQALGSVELQSAGWHERNAWISREVANKYRLSPAEARPWVAMLIRLKPNSLGESAKLNPHQEAWMERFAKYLGIRYKM